MAIEIVSFPIDSMVMFHRFLLTFTREYPLFHDHWNIPMISRWNPIKSPFSIIFQRFVSHFCSSVGIPKKWSDDISSNLSVCRITSRRIWIWAFKYFFKYSRIFFCWCLNWILTFRFLTLVFYDIYIHPWLFSWVNNTS